MYFRYMLNKCSVISYKDLSIFSLYSVEMATKYTKFGHAIACETYNMKHSQYEEYDNK